jgi:hypothetical protein
MDMAGLEQKLVQQWQQAADDLGIRVMAPVELRDANGRPFTCEAWVGDFGSANGAVVISPRTERRVRASLESIREQIWISKAEKRLTSYNRRHFVDELVDWGWFGKDGDEPSWYSDRRPMSG